MTDSNTSIAELVPEILWEDDSLAVLAKPAGMIVNRADSVRGFTVQDWAEQQWGENHTWQESLEDRVFLERMGMVHRIDKDTSGILLWAKTAAAMHSLMNQFENRQVNKTYLALVHGQLPEKVGVVRAPIDRNPQNRTKFHVTESGRPSETQFRVQETFLPLSADALRQVWREQGLESETWLNTARNLYDGGFSLVELQPKTGRTHQIRVHMDYLHHPLVGDARYTGRKRARLDEIWCSRQWLHAWRLEFTHPFSGVVMPVEAPIPEDLMHSLSLLRGISQ